MAKVIDKDMGWERIKLNFKQLEGRSVKVGVMGGEENDGVAIVDYAVYNEFGTSRIPPRPFMATTAENNREYIQQFTGHLVGRIIDGAISVNGEKVTDLEYSIDAKDRLEDAFSIVRRGKKKYHMVKFV